MKTTIQAGRRHCGGSVHDRNCAHGGAFLMRAQHSPRYRVLDGHGGGSARRQFWAKLAPISRSLKQWIREPYGLRHDYLFTSTGAPKMRSALCLLILLWNFPAMADQFSIVCHLQG
jgi:hypothetical protein